MNHDGDGESLPSVDNDRDAGHCLGRPPPHVETKAFSPATEKEGKISHAVAPVHRQEPKANPKLVPPPVSEVLPEMKCQWTPCRPGEGMHVCRAMLEHISIIGSRDPMPHHPPLKGLGATPSFDEQCTDVDWTSTSVAKAEGAHPVPWCSAEFEELRGQMAVLERLLSASLRESGRVHRQADVPAKTRTRAAHEAAPSSSLAEPTTLRTQKGLFLPTCDACAHGAERLPSETSAPY